MFNFINKKTKIIFKSLFYNYPKKGGRSANEWYKILLNLIRLFNTNLI